MPRRKRKNELVKFVEETMKKITLVHAQYAAQLTASALFVVLYVWGTYSAPQLGSWRYFLDLSLLAFFAVDYIVRLKVNSRIGLDRHVLESMRTSFCT